MKRLDRGRRHRPRGPAPRRRVLALTSVSGSRLRTDESGNSSTGYAVGATATIHATVDNVSDVSFLGPSTTILWIDSGDPKNPAPVCVERHGRPVVTPSETVYMPATLGQTFLGIECWQVSSPSDIHAASTLD